MPNAPMGPIIRNSPELQFQRRVLSLAAAFENDMNEAAMLLLPDHERT